MAKLFTFTGSIVLLLVVAVTAALLQPEWAADLGWEEETGLAGLCLPALPSKETRQMEVLRQRIAVKEPLIEELLTGRHTLFETAALFRRVEEAYPTPLPYVHFPHVSVEENFCWQVITWVRSTLYKRFPAQAAEALVVRFEEELRLHKEQNGKVVLPEVVD